MILASILLLAAAQDAGEPLKDAGKPPIWSDDQRFADYGLGQEKPPVARAEMQRFGACVADVSTERASRTLASDFSTAAYRRSMDQLIDANRGCAKGRGWAKMRSSRLLLAGAIAERLIERDPAPVNVRLARAAALPAAATYSPTDGGAMCVVRSAPDEVGKLFATEIGSAEEVAASVFLEGLFSRCMGGRPVEATPSALRAMLATAAFRSVNSRAEN
ncbi:hypothetical protein ACFQ1E_11920 [Sphingomonas canadensis]|uniref:Uncharacterized protein n=1 Tax=Sphingomonas canadensis TaxID=1219257 RepID=A0ABW3HC39_9SPHN|nr:hypothetical protein [Sphingomonas canadensis]MCW3836819.1 hypothetical protein [Sphingomonas canadensis]